MPKQYAQCCRCTAVVVLFFIANMGDVWAAGKGESSGPVGAPPSISRQPSMSDPPGGHSIGQPCKKKKSTQKHAASVSSIGASKGRSHHKDKPAHGGKGNKRGGHGSREKTSKHKLPDALPIVHEANACDRFMQAYPFTRTIIDKMPLMKVLRERGIDWSDRQTVVQALILADEKAEEDKVELARVMPAPETAVSDAFKLLLTFAREIRDVHDEREHIISESEPIGEPESVALKLEKLILQDPALESELSSSGRHYLSFIQAWLPLLRQPTKRMESYARIFHEYMELLERASDDTDEKEALWVAVVLMGLSSPDLFDQIVAENWVVGLSESLPKGKKVKDSWSRKHHKSRSRDDRIDHVLYHGVDEYPPMETGDYYDE
ncbi:hypothetical protein PAHA111176_22415 [Parendozoicomonas haliclonae]|uniref:Uncharacterized protein n=2 Tax=Parendozoicomonas haliclonae TaxID=1960125 RepID=A0A1X7ARQ1_9GAMM|nr:hypothetical protein EHSB41UT_04595 [Parendozoicomonas haliclonae]